MMLKKLLSLSLVILLLPAVNAVSILAQKGQVDSPVEKIKANVAKRGVGKKARVTVKLRDGSKLKGYISQAGEESFTLTDSKSGQSKTLAYVDVLQVKGQGGLSLGAKLAIAVGITVGALALLYGIACGNDPYC